MMQRVPGILGYHVGRGHRGDYGREEIWEKFEGIATAFMRLVDVDGEVN